MSQRVISATESFGKAMGFGVSAEGPKAVAGVGNILRVPRNGNSTRGLKDCCVLEYDTEQQVAGNHLLYAWETLVRVMS